MRPRHYCRGDLPLDERRDVPWLASMRPRHYCRGDGVARPQSFAEFLKLQGGRGITAAEIWLNGQQKGTRY